MPDTISKIWHQSDFRTVDQNYQHVLAMIFAIQEINQNLKLLPNTTLGFHINDNLFDERRTYEKIMDLLFPEPNHVFNYECGRKNDILSVIGGLTVEYATQMASILNIYKIPQVRVQRFTYRGISFTL